MEARAGNSVASSLINNTMAKTLAMRSTSCIYLVCGVCLELRRCFHLSIRESCSACRVAYSIPEAALRKSLRRPVRFPSGSLFALLCLDQYVIPQVRFPIPQNRWMGAVRSSRSDMSFLPINWFAHLHPMTLQVLPKCVGVRMGIYRPNGNRSHSGYTTRPMAMPPKPAQQMRAPVRREPPQEMRATMKLRRQLFCLGC